MGWTLPWYSSDGSDFNYDFHVSSDEAIAPIEYNHKDKEPLERENLASTASANRLPNTRGRGPCSFMHRR